MSHPIDVSEVKVASTPEEKSRIFAARYQALVEDGQAPDSSDGNAIQDAWDETARLLYLEKDGEVVATTRINWLHETHLSAWHQQCLGLARFFRQYPPSAVAVGSQLFARRSHRKSQVLSQLLGYAYLLMHENETVFELRQCSPSFVPIYEVLGYRRYKAAVPDGRGGQIIPLALPIEDTQSLKRIDSPLWTVASRFESRAGSSQWLRDEWRDFLLPNAAADAGVDSATGTALAIAPPPGSRSLDQDDMPLFRGLSEEEIKRFTIAGKTIAFRRGDTIVASGYTGDEMFLVLSGLVEVRAIQNGMTVPLDSFGKGEVFGEVSFLMGRRRSADVVALTDGSLLEISHGFLERNMTQLPRLTTRFLYNLSVMLCGRLCSTTVQLTLAKSGGPS